MIFFTVLLYLTVFVLTFAHDDLSRNKAASQYQIVAGPTFDASNAVDRNTETCMRTEQIGGSSDLTSTWWKVDLGGVYSIHSVIIMFKNYVGYESRQRGRFAGFSLYISNNGIRHNSSLCYQDGPELPPVIFNITCVTSGRYVTVYNERLKGVTYPEGYEITQIFMELCEVIVTGCNEPGVYGSNCAIPCHTNCKYNTCHIQNGNCFGCKPGWTGTTCNTKCADGLHGENCTKQCSDNCLKNVPCNHVTGHCDGGCAAGWRGSFCANACANGTYGENCVHNCSGHCLNNTLCNKQTGHCERGCKPGYTNDLCNKTCTHGFYGNDCRFQCSDYCSVQKKCDHIHGACIGGCQDGYTGKLCNASCEENKYGRNCSGVCSPNCKTCQHTDGKCSCYAGWMGFNCSTACYQSYGEDCRYPCSPHCFNQTSCDRFTGHCPCGCEERFRGKKCDQDIFSDMNSQSSSSFWKYGGPVFVGISIIFVICALMSIWGVYTKRVLVSPYRQPHVQSNLYAEVTPTPEECSHYQELGPCVGRNDVPNSTV